MDDWLAARANASPLALALVVGERHVEAAALHEALGQLGVWVRLHYVYPYPHVDELIPLMADGRILPYLVRAREEFGVPMLFVSHDATEVEAVAAVVRGGW